MMGPALNKNRHNTATTIAHVGISCACWMSNTSATIQRIREIKKIATKVATVIPRIVSTIFYLSSKI